MMTTMLARRSGLECRNKGADDDALFATYEDVAASCDEVLKSIGECDEFRAFWSERHGSQTSAD